MSGVTYELNEVVMCKSRAVDTFGYPAKIQEVDDTTPGKRRYEIHFRGWNSRYDVWIEHDEVPNMLFKHTPEIEAQHKNLLEISKTKTPKKKNTTESSLPSNMRKRKVEREKSPSSTQTTGSRSTAAMRNAKIQEPQETMITFPEKLNPLLVEDQDIVDRQQRLVKLPARYTVDQIAQEFADAVAIRRDLPDHRPENPLVLNKTDLVNCSRGVLDYFNILLGDQALYVNEREQFKNSCVNPPSDAPGTRVDASDQPELEDLKIVPSSVYGVVHLVRIFFRIGPLITPGVYGDDTPHVSIVRHTNEFISFVSKNVAKYHNSKTDYEPAPENSMDTTA